MTWTDESLARLRDMHSEGASFSEIANALGVSRNAAIGKANRLQLPKRGAPKSIARNREKAAEARQRRRRPPPADARIRALWREGYSAAQIAEQIDANPGSVRSRISRLGLSKARRETKPSPRSDAPVAAHTLPPQPVVAPESAPVTFLDRGHDQCAYLLDAPTAPDPQVCGAPVITGKSWCQHHYGRVFRQEMPGGQ